MYPNCCFFVAFHVSLFTGGEYFSWSDCTKQFVGMFSLSCMAAKFSVVPLVSLSEYLHAGASVANKPSSSTTTRCFHVPPNVLPAVSVTTVILWTVKYWCSNFLSHSLPVLVYELKLYATCSFDSTYVCSGCKWSHPVKFDPEEVGHSFCAHDYSLEYFNSLALFELQSVC